MKKLIIIGAGGFGREVLGYLLDIKKLGVDWEIEGFIDDNCNALNGYNIDYPIIGSIKNHIFKENEVFVCAIGDTKTKLSICRYFESNGANFINLIHPLSRVGNSCKIGRGVIFTPFSIVTENVEVGNFVTINVSSGAGHDAILGDGCTLSGHCDVTGFAKLGEGVFLGSHSTIAPKVKIGDYARIGAGSVVLKNVKANDVVFGNPAKVIF